MSLYNWRCSCCGRFVKGQATYDINGLGQIRNVRVVCGQCGEVDVYEWDYDDFEDLEPDA